MGDVGSHSEEEFRECFSLFAKEKNRVAEFEFGCCLRSMALNPTEKETKELFAEVAKDVEGVQKADVDAVLAAGRKYAKVMAAADQEQGLRDALKVLDKEGNGMVSSAELRHIVANLKVKTEKIGDEMVHTPIGDEELDEAMEEIDPKKAGQIKIDHLVKEVFKKVHDRACLGQGASHAEPHSSPRSSLHSSRCTSRRSARSRTSRTGPSARASRK